MSDARTRALRTLTLLSACLICLLLVACGDDQGDDEPAAAAPAAQFPRTIEHKLGTTEIPARPRRVVALGAIERDLVAALDAGLVGAGFPERNRPGAVPPWVEPALEGVEMLSIKDGIPFEQVAAQRPDLILAQSVFNELTPQDYETLSQIAPTVAFQTGGFTDEWQGISRTAGRALGREQEAERVVRQVEDQLDAAARANPSFADRSFMVSNVFGPDMVGAIVTDEDPTTKVLSRMGFSLSPAVRELEPSEAGSTTGPVSLERLDLLDADVLFLNYAVPDAQQGLESNPVFKQLDVVKRDANVGFQPDEWTALRDPSVLSLPYVIENIVPRLEGLDLRGDQ